MSLNSLTLIYDKSGKFKIQEMNSGLSFFLVAYLYKNPSSVRYKARST